MTGITRIHRLLRSLSAPLFAASEREAKVKPGTCAAKLVAFCCTPRSIPPYLCVTPRRGPVSRVRST